MLKDAWQSIVGRCAVFLFRVFRLLLQTYDIILNDLFPRACFPQAPLSKILSIAADLFLQRQHLSKGKLHRNEALKRVRVIEANELQLDRFNVSLSNFYTN